ncbi:MAG: hypothetical protein R2752_18790 [Vicinamibacterales bacterium]
MAIRGHPFGRALLAMALVCVVAGRVAAQGSGQSASQSPPVASPDAFAPDPAETRLIWLPTARTLPRGDMSLTLFGPMPIVQFGITDRVSAGVGFFPLSVGEGQVFLLTPKWQVVRRERTSVAVGAYHVGGFVDVNAGLAYAVVTHGDDRAAVHAGIGLWYAIAESERGSTPAAYVGVERRVSRHLKVVADASVLESYWTATTAVRVIRGRGAGDIGLAILPFDDSVLVFPTFMWMMRF